MNPDTHPRPLPGGEMPVTAPVCITECSVQAELMHRHLAEARRHHRTWVRQLAQLPDRKLSRRLDILRTQQEWAWHQGQPLALELMRLYIRQTIEARLAKQKTA